MKTLKFLAVLLVAISLVSCNKDDDNNNPGNTNNNNGNPSGPTSYMKIDGKTYEMPQGYLLNYGLSDDGSYAGYNTDIEFFSKDVKITMDQDGDYEFTGTGHTFYLEMFSTSGSSLDVATYTFNDNTPVPVKHYDWGEVELNYNFDTDQDGTIYEDLTGDVKVQKNGSDYVIDYKGTDMNGESIEFHYEGKLQYLNVSGAKK